jgi:hypothetical protein
VARTPARTAETVQRDQRVATPAPADSITSTMTRQHQCLTRPSMRGDRSRPTSPAPHGSDDRPARPLPVLLLDGKLQNHQHHVGSSLGTFGSMLVLLSLTASSERRNRMPEDGMTRQCATAHGVGASRNRRSA